MSALARAEKTLTQALEDDAPKEDERRAVENHLSVISVSLRDMRSSMVVADVQLAGMCEEFHLERLKLVKFDTVGQLICVRRARVEEVLQDNFGLARGIFGLLVSDKTYRRP
jgi:hypothetical protein